MVTALDETDKFISFQLDVEGRTKDISQFSSVTQSCLTLCDPMDCSTPGFPGGHQLLELAPGDNYLNMEDGNSVSLPDYFKIHQQGHC